MSKLDAAIRQVQKLDTIAKRDQWVNKIHPLVKFALTIGYLIIIMSFSRYDLIGLLGMIIYPLALFILADLSFSEALGRLRVVLPLVCVMSIFNPIFDRVPVVMLGIHTTTGMISMITLIMKGVFAVLASYLLIATTPMEQICYALQMIHVPGILITEILLIYRYITLLLGEVDRITKAYSLRAPGQKGIHFKVWGSLTGLLLLRSMDRAETVYQAMSLRGFQGDFSYLGDDIIFQKTDFFYLLFWMMIFALFRCVPVLFVIGNLFC